MAYGDSILQEMHLLSAHSSLVFEVIASILGQKLLTGFKLMLTDIKDP